MPTIVCPVIVEWDSILLLHRKDRQKEWELPAIELAEGQDPKEAAKQAAKNLMQVDIEIEEKLGEKGTFIWFLAKITKGIPKAPEGSPYDRIRYMEFFILAKKTEKLSSPLAALVEKIRKGKIHIEKKSTVKWK